MAQLEKRATPVSLPRVVAVAGAIAALGLPLDARADAGSGGGPDFAAAARVLDLDRSVEFARRGRRMLDAVIADDQRLEDAALPLVKGDDGRLFLRGDGQGDEPRLVWLDELDAPPSSTLADFVLRAEAASDHDVRSARLSFHSLVGLTPAETVALAGGVIAALDGSDEAILAAYRRDLPQIAAWSARIVDLKRAKIVAPGAEPDYTTLAMEAPLDEEALARYYPSLQKLLGWAREITWRITDSNGRVLAALRFDGDERTFRVLEWKRGDSLLWGDGTKPLRDSSGALIPVGFDLAHDAEFHVELAARAVLFKLGAVRLGSFTLPSSDLDLRYLSDGGDDKANWQLRIRSIGDAPTVVEWMLPLAKLRESLVRTFQMSLVSVPSGSATSIYDMGLVLGAELPQSASLDFAQALNRWASDSLAFADVLRAARDFAAAAEQDLSALRTPAVARAGPAAP